MSVQPHQFARNKFMSTKATRVINFLPLDGTCLAASVRMCVPRCANNILIRGILVKNVKWQDCLAHHVMSVEAVRVQNTKLKDIAASKSNKLDLTALVAIALLRNQLWKIHAHPIVNNTLLLVIPAKN